jgi:hypothetical protein
MGGPYKAQQITVVLLTKKNKLSTKQAKISGNTCKKDC